MARNRLIPSCRFPNHRDEAGYNYWEKREESQSAAAATAARRDAGAPSAAADPLAVIADTSSHASTMPLPCSREGHASPHCHCPQR